MQIESIVCLQYKTILYFQDLQLALGYNYIGAGVRKP